MATIKNWTVTAKTMSSVEEAISYATYLADERHPNHGETEILEIYGDARELAYRASANAIRKNEQNRRNQGGRPPCHLVSFNFVLPSPLNLRPSKRQWQLIAKDVLKGVSKQFDISLSQLLKHCFLNVHNQSNSHLNLIFANVWESESGELSTMRALKQRAFLATLKRSFTLSANRVLGIDHETYKPLEIGLGARVNLQRAMEDLNGKNLNLDDFLTSQSNRLDKLIHAVGCSDTKQINRQSNRISKDFSADPVIQSKLKKLLCQYPKSFSSLIGPRPSELPSPRLKKRGWRPE